MFYERQNDLAGVYEGGIQGYHEEKATLISKYYPQAKNVLELGAGGGQVACATARSGFSMTAVELSTELSKHIEQLASEHQIENLQVINDDFYTVELDQKFDVITYWDGFGIGDDNDQMRILERCRDWLTENGMMLVDVMTPWYWAQAHGQEMSLGDASRRYTFDAVGCRMVDTWWRTDRPDEAVSQTLRCYSPADLQLLLRQAGLALSDVVDTGGAVDYAQGSYDAHVELHRAMSYVAKIQHLR